MTDPIKTPYAGIPLDTNKARSAVRMHNAGKPLAEIAVTLRRSKLAIEDYLSGREGYPGPIVSDKQESTVLATKGKGMRKHPKKVLPEPEPEPERADEKPNAAIPKQKTVSLAPLAFLTSRTKCGI